MERVTIEPETRVRNKNTGEKGIVADDDLPLALKDGVMVEYFRDGGLVLVKEQISDLEVLGNLAIVFHQQACDKCLWSNGKKCARYSVLRGILVNVRQHDDSFIFMPFQVYPDCKRQIAQMRQRR